MGFQLVPKSMTFNDLERHNSPYSKNVKRRTLELSDDECSKFEQVFFYDQKFLSIVCDTDFSQDVSRMLC